MSSNEDPAAKLARKKRERLEASTHALAIVALAREVYPDDERRRLLTEHSALIEAHEAVVLSSLEEKVPETASLEEKEAYAVRVVGKVRAASEAWEAFNKKHPLISYMNSYRASLTQSLYT